MYPGMHRYNKQRDRAAVPDIDTTEPIDPVIAGTGEINASASGRQPVDASLSVLPRVTWLHWALAAVTTGAAVWLVLDWINGLRNPIVSGHLRAGFVAVSVSLVMVASNYRLYRRVQRLHAKMGRAVVDLAQTRAAIAELKAIADEHVARIVTQQAEQQDRDGVGRISGSQSSTGAAEAAFESGSRDAQEADVVAMPNSRAFELGRVFERRKQQLDGLAE